MANQKEFKLVINGVEESISKIDALSKQIDNLGQRIDELSNKKISIQADISGGNVDTAATAAVTAELEKQKQAAKELAQLNRDIANGAKDADGNYTNTLAGMRKQLSEMKKELSTMELGTDAWSEMSAKVNDVNTQVKDLEKSFGVFNRQVGNYEIVSQGMSKLSISVGGVEKEFSNAREASKELKNELNSLGAKMYELEKAGQTGSEEYQQLAQRFNEVAQASDQLEHITEYTERMSNSIKDDSGAIGELARSMDSLNAIVNVGVGVMGMFGDTSEETQKAINRTVQVTTVMKGIQQLINNEFQKGAPLVKLWNAAVTSTSTALGATTVSSAAAATGIRLFSKALIATGIGAIVVALGELIANFEDLNELLGLSEEESEALGKVWDKTKEILSGVGNVIIQKILAPIRALVKVFQGDFKGAAQEMLDSLDMIAAYEEGANKQAVKNEKNKQKEQAKTKEKDLKKQIALNEAKYGSDWKYTEEAKKMYQEMFAQRLAMYETDSDDYMQVQIEKENYDRQYTEHIKKTEDDARKNRQSAYSKQQSDAKAHADKMKDINRKLEDYKLEIMEDGFTKEQAKLKLLRQRALEEAKASGIKVREQQELINRMYDKKELELTTQHIKNISEKYSDTMSKMNNNLFNNLIDSYKTQLEELYDIAEKASDRINKLIKPVYYGGTIGKNVSQNLSDILNSYISSNNLNANAITNELPIEQTKRFKALSDEIKQFSKESSEAFKQWAKELEISGWKSSKSIEEVYEKFSNIPDVDFSTDIKKGYNDLLKQFEDYSNFIEKMKKDNMYDKLNDENKKMLDESIKIYQKYYDNLQMMLKRYYDDYYREINNNIQKQLNLNTNGLKNIQKGIKEQLDGIDEILQNYNLKWQHHLSLIPKGLVPKLRSSLEDIKQHIEIEIKTIEDTIENSIGTLTVKYALPDDNNERIRENNKKVDENIESNRQWELKNKQYLEDEERYKKEQEAQDKLYESALKDAEELKKKNDEAFGAALKQWEDKKNQDKANEEAYNAAVKLREEEIAAGKAKVQAENEANAAKKKATEEAIANAKKENEARQQAYDIALKDKEEQEKKNEALREYIKLVQDLIKVNKLADEENTNLNLNSNHEESRTVWKTEGEISRDDTNVVDWGGKYGYQGEDTDLDRLSNEIAKREVAQRKALKELGINIQTVDKVLTERIQQAEENVKEIADVKQPEMVEIPVVYTYDEKSFELPPEVEVPVKLVIDESSKPKREDYKDVTVNQKDYVANPITATKPNEKDYIKNVGVKEQESDIKSLINTYDDLKAVIASCEAALNGLFNESDVDSYGFQTVYNILLNESEIAAEEFKANNGQMTENVKSILIPKLKELYEVSGHILDLEAMKREYEQVKQQTDETINDLSNKLQVFAKKVQQWWNEYGQFVEQGLQVANMAIDTAFDNMNAAIEKELDEIDESLDELDEAYQAAEELEEKHKDKVNDIESELATARGDRRTALLDQLNQEVAARERAFQTEQKIKKQQEALQKRQEQLQKQEDENEKKRAKAKKITSLIQATINTALGVTNALASCAPPPAYVLAAIVGALGAAEIATIASQQIYAKGGVLEGKSHAQGGIKVLGGQAEVEGGEYITNKATTQKNVELLEYINSKNKTFTLADFQKFYSGNKPNFNNIDKMKFATGGRLNAPQMTTRDIKEMYISDTRPVVVSVVDIVDQTRNLRNVQVLAGENPDF